MTPVERYSHLEMYWRQQYEERRAEMTEAQQQYEHWRNKKVAAEIADKLAKEDLS